MLNSPPKLSIITHSLNHGRFLRDTIDSIISQSYKNFEHIIIDGGSTDNTMEILREYPHIRWVSEKDDPKGGIADVYRKAFSMSQGEYIIQCCVSDGFLNKNWFSKCIEILDTDHEVSLVWGFPQYMSEEGNLTKISYSEFFDDPPPQKTDFFAYWLVTAFILPEGNYCVRREVFDICFPKGNLESPFKSIPHSGFNYNFNTLGYLPYFIPLIANYGRTHKDSRGQLLYEKETILRKKYRQYVKNYRSKFLNGEIVHYFRNGSSEVINKVSSKEFNYYRKKIWRYQITESRFMRLPLYTLYKKLFQRLKRQKKADKGRHCSAPGS